MSKIVLRHILEKHFGKHEKIKFAEAEIINLFGANVIDNPDINLTDLGYKPAYLDASEENLLDGQCRFCEMIWYNCICPHDK